MAFNFERVGVPDIKSDKSRYGLLELGRDQAESRYSGLCIIKYGIGLLSFWQTAFEGMRKDEFLVISI